MTKKIEDQEISDFFDQFCEAFATFDGKQVRERFIAPGIALKHDGSLESFSKPEDIEVYYQSALDYYKSSGCNACRWSDLDIHRFHNASLVATVSWDLVHEDGHVLRHWRQAYFVARFDGEIRIYGSAFVSA